MQSLLTSFFVSNQIYIVIALLVIASVYLFNYMIKRFKVTINFKKFMYDSPYLKVNTLFTSINEKHQIKLINKLIDKKIIDKKDYEKAINVSKSMLVIPISTVSPASVSPASVSPASVSPALVPPSPPSPPSLSPQSVSQSSSSSSVLQSPTITSANK